MCPLSLSTKGTWAMKEKMGGDANTNFQEVASSSSHLNYHWLFYAGKIHATGRIQNHIKGFTEKVVEVDTWPIPSHLLHFRTPSAREPWFLSIFLLCLNPYLVYQCHNMPANYIIKDWHSAYLEHCPAHSQFLMIIILVFLFAALSLIFFISSTGEIIVQNLWISFSHSEPIYKQNLEDINTTIKHNVNSIPNVKVKIHVLLTEMDR